MNIVKTIYDKYLQLKSQTGLETYMLKNDIKTKNSKDFARWGLVNILTNPVYAIADNDTLEYFKQFDIEIFASELDFDGSHGLMVYNKTEKKGKTNQVVRKDISEWIVAIGKHQGVINGKDWVEVQQLLDKNADKRYRKPAQNNALLSGVLKCAHSGSFMRPKLKGKDDLDNQGNRRFDYMCALKDKSRKTKCDCTNINGVEADNLVMKTIKELINPKHEFYKTLESLSKSIDTTDNNSNEINLLKSEYKKNENDINNLLDRIKYINVDLLDEVQTEIKKLKNANMEIEKQMKALTKDSDNFISDSETASLVVHILDTYFNTFDTLDLVHKRDLIKLLVSSVYSDGKDITINLIGTKELDNNSIIPLCEDSKRNTNITEQLIAFEVIFNKLFSNLKNQVINIKIKRMDLMTININKNKSFGNQLKYQRVKKNIKQTELASMLNVTREVILNLENKEKLLYNVSLLKNLLSIVDSDNNIQVNDAYLKFLLDNPSEKIRLCRERHNLNKSQFAELMKVHIKTIRCWENGNNVISKENYNTFQVLQNQ